MPWNSVLIIWQDLIDQLCSDFPYLDKVALIRFRGDRSKLVTYLADTHDLTEREANDVLRDWIDFTAKRVRTEMAA